MPRRVPNQKSRLVAAGGEQGLPTLIVGFLLGSLPTWPFLLPMKATLLL